jgi:hypothetical protein
LTPFVAVKVMDLRYNSSRTYPLPNLLQGRDILLADWLQFTGVSPRSLNVFPGIIAKSTIFDRISKTFGMGIIGKLLRFLLTLIRDLDL